MKPLTILAAVTMLATPARAEFDCQHFIKVESQIAQNAGEEVHARKNRNPNDDAVDITYEQGRIYGVLEIIQRLQAECF